MVQTRKTWRYEQHHGRFHFQTSNRKFGFCPGRKPIILFSFAVLFFVLLIPALTHGQVATRKQSEPKDQDSSTENEKVAWTLILYLAADCNLERAILDNLAETMVVGSSDDVHIVALVDRHPDECQLDVDEATDDEGYPLFTEDDLEKKRRFTNRPIGQTENWSSAKVFYVNRDELVEIEDLGEANTGDAQTLEYLLSQVVKYYPAKRYGLIMGGHGEAWKSVCPDDSSDHSTMNMPQLRKALSNGLKQPLEFLGFDACLMANYEVLHSLDGLARVVIASEEISPGEGWNYASLARTLTQNPQADGMAVSKAMGEAFFSYFAKADPQSLHSATFSAIDMNQFAEIRRSVDSLGKTLTEELKKQREEAWTNIVRANANTTEYGEGGEYSASEELFDLHGFADQIINNASDSKTIQAAKNVTAAIEKATIFNLAGEGREGSHGLTVYLPFRQQEYLAETLANYRKIPNIGSHAWFNFILSVEEFTDIAVEVEILGEVYVESDDDEELFYAAVTKPENFIAAEFFLARDSKHESELLVLSNFDPYDYDLLEPDEDGDLTASWNGTWFELRHGKQRIPCAKIEKAEYSDGSSYFEAPFQLLDRTSGTWETVLIEFFCDEENEEFYYECAWVLDDDSRHEIELVRGQKIRPIRIIVDRDGALDAIPDEEHVLKIHNPDKLQLDFAPIPQGKYVGGFANEDLKGEIHVAGAEFSN